MAGLVVVILSFSSALALGEYRAYRLALVHELTKQRRVVVSTLDHLQYSTYYPVAPSETVEYLESWICPGRTADFAQTCPNPAAIVGLSKAQQDSQQTPPSVPAATPQVAPVAPVAPP